MLINNVQKSILSVWQGGFLFVNYVKKLDFVKMSGVLDDGDSPLHYFYPPLYIYFLPQFTTTIGPVTYKKGDFPPL